MLSFIRYCSHGMESERGLEPILNPDWASGQAGIITLLHNIIITGDDQTRAWFAQYLKCMQQKVRLQSLPLFPSPHPPLPLFPSPPPPLPLFPSPPLVPLTSPPPPPCYTPVSSSHHHSPPPPLIGHSKPPLSHSPCPSHFLVSPTQAFSRDQTTSVHPQEAPLL